MKITKQKTTYIISNDHGEKVYLKDYNGKVSIEPYKGGNAFLFEKSNPERAARIGELIQYAAEYAAGNAGFPLPDDFKRVFELNVCAEATQKESDSNEEWFNKQKQRAYAGWRKTFGDSETDWEHAELPPKVRFVRKWLISPHRHVVQYRERTEDYTAGPNCFPFSRAHIRALLQAGVVVPVWSN